MNTIYAKVDADDIDMSVIKKAGRIIKDGGIVAFPTETVYGLGGDALNADSSRKIYEAKGRPSDNPLIVHIADMDDLYKIVTAVSPEAKELAARFWPGPLTMIFPKNPTVPDRTTGGLDTVAVRFPSHPVAQAFIKAAGGFIAAPSANISGRPSPTTGKHVLEDMSGRIDMIIDSGKCDIGLESTIIDLTSDEPMMLRPGYVSEKMLEEAIGKVRKDPAVFGDTSKEAPRAPGMKYRHYAPKGELSVVSGSRTDVISYIKDRISERKEGIRIGVLTCSDNAKNYEGADLVADIGDEKNEKTIASNLYDALRRCDDEKIDRIYSEEFNTPQLGLAIMNRLIKAAGHNTIKV
ncbi:MAG: threonylcarbamoyl-AMP synthase [Lachnospiraceae bacterium]|nr:threonylcarbamoyl-AMP synthase [Lachnospiraceae bacterium]